MIAIVGTAGLQPALAAIRAGKDIAVASKEILVMAGEIVMNEARKHGVRVLAVDSEHSAIFQCLDGKPPSSVRKLWLTASGGPFRDKTIGRKEKFSEITVERALKHPSWVMGRKITIDSATLFNKGLEMIEARWLFDIEMARVGVVVHPQSIVHSMVEFVDGSLIAQLSTPDMCLPIQYALTYPDRAASDRVQTNFPKIGTLTFEEPDMERFPACAHQLQDSFKNFGVPFSPFGGLKLVKYGGSSERDSFDFADRRLTAARWRACADGLGSRFNQQREIHFT